MPHICRALITAHYCACVNGHDISAYCPICDLFCSSTGQLSDHQGGRKHLRKLIQHGSAPFSRCPICASQFLATKVGWLVHLSSTQHRQLDRARPPPLLGACPPPPPVEAHPPPPPVAIFICDTCQRLFKTQKSRKQHELSSQSHKSKLLTTTAAAVSSGRAPQQPIPVAHASLASARPPAPQMGRRRQRMFFRGRFVAGPARSVYSSIPYKRKLKDHLLDMSVVVEGSEEERLNKIKKIIPTNLDCASYAKHWHTLIHVEEEQMIRDIETYDLTGVTLRPQRNLFYIPHVAYGADISRLVQVPGLAEKRPSILIDDSVYVRLQHMPEKFFEGRVSVVNQQEVGMAFDKSFHYSIKNLCDVKFTITRIPIRRMHESLDGTYIGRRVLFPSQKQVINFVRPTRSNMAAIIPINPLIATNPPQLEAVAAILSRSPGSVPFIVFGPPGTGKTVTIVEAMSQLVALHPQIHILACAPSNSAADLIAQRLSHLGSQRLFRLNAPFRKVDDIPVDLLPFCYIDSFGRFSVTSAKDLAKFNVVVSTCMSAGIPSGIKMPIGHFAYIFIDEAGQAMEPEAMVSIKTMSDTNTQVVLSGDPLQLGPIIRSGVARRLGLGLSYLQRLMDREIYREDTWHGINVVKLVKNFRSHEAILDFPNDEFYGSQLEVCGHRPTINRFVGSPVLPNPTFPVVFHGVAGKDDRNPDSPSYFNESEASVVTEYVQQLLDDHEHSITPSEIGVIAPYRAQSAKLRTDFHARGYRGLKVGSVEEYQGQERDVIILTTVRTDRERVTYDLRHTLGFLVNPRRVNVAITRPKGLLIIVGDPLVLGLDPLWRKLMNYIHLNGGWTGQPPNWDTTAEVKKDPEAYVRERQARQDANMEDLTQRLMDAVIGNGRDASTSGAQDAEEQLDTSGDRPWREYH